VRYVTQEEFRIAADLLGRPSDIPCANDAMNKQESYYDECLRMNAKFVIALYFEQIRLMHLMVPEEIPKS